jgi:putative SOS response-associated peptidase YedK
MPVILSPETYRPWLQEGENDPNLLKSFLKPFPSEEMEAFPVSRVVNNPKNDSAECVLPIE